MAMAQDHRHLRPACRGVPPAAASPPVPGTGRFNRRRSGGSAAYTKAPSTHRGPQEVASCAAADTFSDPCEWRGASFIRTDGMRFRLYGTHAAALCGRPHGLTHLPFYWCWPDCCSLIGEAPPRPEPTRGSLRQLCSAMHR